MAISLNFNNDAFPLDGGDGIAFDPITGDLFAIATLQIPNEEGDAPEIVRANAVLYRLQTDGTEVFPPVDLVTQSEILVTEEDAIDGALRVVVGTVVDGLEILPNGNFLISSASSGRVLEIDRNDFVDGNVPEEFTPVEGGINFQNDDFRFIGVGVLTPSASLVYNSDSDSIFLLFDNSGTAEIRGYDTDGNLIQTIDLSSIVTDINPEGIEIDPVTGNFIVADDAGGFGQPPGNSSIHEITPEGELVSSTSLVGITGGDLTFSDAEGIAIDDETRNLYVVFDDDPPGVLTGDTSQVGDQIASFQIGTPTAGLQLNLVDNFAANSPDALVWDSGTETIFTLDNVSLTTDLTVEGIEITLTQYDTDGNVLSSSDALDDELINALGLAQLPNGNFITSDIVGGRIVEIDTSGNIVEGGIDLQSPSLSFLQGGQALVSLAYDAESESIYGTDFFTGQFLEIGTELGDDGNIDILSEIDLTSIVPGIAASGLAIDPVTGNFIVADDISAGGGNNQFHIITPAGELAGSIDAGDFGIDDPEGLSFDADNRRLYVAYDDDAATGNQIAVFDLTDSFVVDQNSDYLSSPLLTVGQTIPLLEGEFPFLATDPNGLFPVDNLGEVDSGDSPLTASDSETFTLPGNLDGVDSANFDGINYVFLTHSNDADVTTETNGGQINGSRISLLAFDEDWNIIGGRNLVERIRIANIEATNALRSTVNPDTGNLFLGLVFGEYVLNPETGDYEGDLEAGVIDPVTGEETFIVGNATFLGLESDVAGQTWLERLLDTFPENYNPLGNENFANFGSILSADTGFRRRGGQAIPFVFSGESVDNGIAAFHIANGTTVPIEGFGSFAKGQIISALDFRQTVTEDGIPFGLSVLLSPEASADDGELYLFAGDRVVGNAGGFADFNDVLYVLQVSDGDGNVVADGTTIAEDTELTAQWVLIDGNPLSDLNAIPEGKAINTLNSGALSDWVNGEDDGVARSTNFENLGGIAEDPTDTGSFYLTSDAGLYNLTFAEDSPTGVGTFTLVQTGDFDSVTVDSDGNVIVQDNEGGSFLYDIDTDSLTPFVGSNEAVIADATLDGITEVDDNFNDTGVSAFLSVVNGGESDGQLLFNQPTASSRFDTDIIRFQSNITPGTYLFTGGDEAQSIRDNFADSFTEEGFAFTVASQPGDELEALYRFRSSQGTYLLVGEDERAAINADPNFSGEYTEEGLAFYVYGAGADEGAEFNRFRNQTLPGAYLYATGDEATTIQTDFTATYVDEGAAFEAVI